MNDSGYPILRVEDPHLLRGDSTFVANLDLPGAAAVHYLCASMAHARISGIDVEAARVADGVLDIVTAADIDEAGFGPIPGHPPTYPDSARRPVLAGEIVRFVGEPIVAIVAETATAAADAVELIDVDYEPLPAVIGFDASLADDTILFPDHGTNTMVTDGGGTELATTAARTDDNERIDFDQFEVVVEATFLNQRLAPSPLETRVAAAWWDGDRLVQHASCQGVHPQRAMLAAWYGMDPEQVRVTTADVGGSFGAKARLYPEELLLGFLAKRIGRPVRFTPTRTADMVGLGHSRAQRQLVRIAGDRDGTIRALEADVLVDCGAYPIAAPALAKNTGVMLPGPFDVELVRWHTTCVVTNTTPIVAYRGAGRPESGALLNRAIDCFALEIGMDPLEVQRRNLLPSSALPHTNPSDLTLDSGDYPAALELAAREADHDAVRSEQSLRRSSERRTNGQHRQIGVGYTTFIDKTAGVRGTEYGALELRSDGSVRVLTGSSPYGQGHYTTWAMLVAERTGIAFDRIEVFHGDTDVVPRGGITGGSRSAQKAGAAVAIATDQLVAEATKHAADLLEAAPGDIVLDIERGAFHVAGSPAARSVDWVEVAGSQADAAGSEDSGAQDSGAIAFACETDFDTDGPSVPYGAYAAVVEVDIETGDVELVKMVSVDDAGTIINEMIVLGQVHGGIGQAIGQALYEEFVYDDDGNPLTSTFLDYSIPSAAEMPSFDAHLMETPALNNPLGAKGIAESGTIGAVPAIQNAVVDALAHLGVRHIDLPLTPQRVWNAIYSPSSAPS